MESQGAQRRIKIEASKPKKTPDNDYHPPGKTEHGLPLQILRIVLFGVYFFGSCFFIHGAQLLFAPLYLINKDHYYAAMAVTKQYFGLLITTMTQWWSPTIVRISGDASVAGQLKRCPDGRIECLFPERLILIANHQIYTDWLYMWWIAYTAKMHGHIYIILKDSLKWVPLIGPAMQMYSFIFIARKWADDQKRLRYRLQKLNTERSDPLVASPSSSTPQLHPMWLLIFPEGTNLSANTRRKSISYADKQGMEDMRHSLLPHSTGLDFCLTELKDTVEYVYDCTIAYERIPTGMYGQDIFTLRSVYFQGLPPKSVNMHWRRFKVSDIPYGDSKAMTDWTLARWREKDALLDEFQQTRRFPSDVSAISDDSHKQEGPFIETEVRTKYPVEFLQMFAPVVTVGLIGSMLVKLVDRVLPA